MDREQLQASVAWRYATRLQRERLTQALRRRHPSELPATAREGGHPAGLAPGTMLPRGR